MKQITAAAAALLLAVSAAFAWWAWLGRPVALVDAPRARFPCVSYAPYTDEQTPFDETLVVPPAQIERDLRRLWEVTGCVRTYSVQQGLAEVVPIASRLGMKVLLGVWIGWKDAKNREEIAAAVDLAGRYPETVAAVIVGNEVLLRREQPPERLAALIREVRAAVPPSVEVTYADVWEFWLQHPEIADAVDFVTIHTLPYWEDDPIGIDEAVPHVVAIVDTVKGAFPGKRLLVGEAGWPSAGRMREGAQPSRVNQARFVRELIVAADEAGIGLNLIEAFDQPWKRRLEGTVGGHWGLFDKNRAAKFPLTGPVREDAEWRRHFIIAAALGIALILAPALTPRRPESFAAWLALAFAGQAAGTLLVAGGLAAVDAVRTPYDVFVWGSRCLLAAAAAALVLLALARDPPVAPIAAERLIEAVRQRARPPGSWLALALGVVRTAIAFGAAVTTFCFLFEARYRDFPVALTLVPAVAFLVLALRRRRRRTSPSLARSDRDLAEERLLAVVLAAGGVAIGLSEALANLQAWGLMLANLTLAAALWLEPRCSEEDQVRSRVSALASKPAAASSGA